MDSETTRKDSPRCRRRPCRRRTPDYKCSNEVHWGHIAIRRLPEQACPQRRGLQWRPPSTIQSCSCAYSYRLWSRVDDVLPNLLNSSDLPRAAPYNTEEIMGYARLKVVNTGMI